ncbi:M10 family metallopeptidase C-terminal domain-containing protein [Yoonia sp.]|uniref:calcium-binding protein n=1 Tax=Yoonia sp. TaxID=2212373 RepID=UPI0019EEEFF4|nr:M10 family metallopeptidase C-terminal domain-containing protein [Yoonia sp.]MBE0413666.1 calcium-binding protein [Yoonia sp.]
MASFSFVTHAVTDADLGWSHITDLDMIQSGGTSVLISTTRFDGVLRSWGIDGSLHVTGEIAYDGGDLPGGTGSIMHLNVGGQTAILTGGATGGPLQTHTVAPDGTFGPSTTLPPSMGGFQHGVTVQLADGVQAVYGALAGKIGIGRLDFTAAGVFAGASVMPGSGGTAVEQIAAFAAVAVGGQDFLLTTSATHNTLTSWAVAPDGSLGAVQTMGVDDGLWIATPSAMAIATVGTTSYIVLGAAGSGTLSVMEIGSDGSLMMRDHLLDTLDTRFGGVTSINIVTHHDQTYVIAGGADDGLSVFVLLEGGFLLARAHIADTTQMGLDNISALAARGMGDGLDIFAASSSKAGLTQLRLDTGVAGITATATLAGGLLGGTAGNDILQGHDGDDVIIGGAGDDIIRDGAGSDTLTGGAGADVFILSADGETDTITDFTLGEDRIDLSLWPMLRDISQLTMTIQPYGMDIRYGDELLIVQSADGQMIDYRLLTNADLIGGSRFPAFVQPGYPGPATPPPDLTPGEPPQLPQDQGEQFDLRSSLAVIATANADRLRSALQGSAAPAQPPAPDATPQVLIGTAAVDFLQGGAGNDILIGRAGNDLLIGGAGPDLLIGGDGNDDLDGGDGHDILYGGAGSDVLRGGAGNDILWGGDDDDTFIFDSGIDIIADFEQGIDQIILDAGLWTGLTSTADLLAIYGSYDGARATIDFDDGNILHIDGVSDYALLADSIALF